MEDSSIKLIHGVFTHKNKYTRINEYFYFICDLELNYLVKTKAFNNQGHYTKNVLKEMNKYGLNDMDYDRSFFPCDNHDELILHLGMKDMLILDEHKENYNTQLKERLEIALKNLDNSK